jgi:hypothetical protein
VTVLASATALRAADPGLPYPSSSQVSDQRPGAALFYNLYSSSVTNPIQQNTRIDITNTSTTSAAFVHLFFVDGVTCSVADSFLCLTANQTASFLASDLDPGTTGFLIAVATDSNGCPSGHNFLIGDEYVKLSTGHQANLAAEAVAAQFDTFGECDEGNVSVTLFFDQAGIGDCYNQLPRVLAVDNVPSRADGNDTLLIVNRIGGDLRVGSLPLRSMFGVLYNDAELAASFTFSSSRCQFISSLTNTFPRTAPRPDSFIPSGRSGWMKIWAAAEDTAILGSVINFNPDAGASSGAYNGGHNLHALRLNGFGIGSIFAPSLTIPVFPPSC